jgi:pimeloyl-ACP methyl ester carboxylesterase
VKARWDGRLWLLAGLAGVAGLAVLHLWTPSNDPATAFCLSRRLLHLPCPGCGMTRAFALLAKGSWRAAVTLHPLAPVLALEAVLGWLAWGTALAVRYPLRLPVRVDTIVLVHAAVLVALWLGRAATGTLPW